MTKKIIKGGAVVNRLRHDLTRVGLSGKQLLVFGTLCLTGSVVMAEQVGFQGGVSEALGRNYTTTKAAPTTLAAPLVRPGTDSVKRLGYWNEIALNAEKLDHTPVAPGETRVFGEQFGPARSSRALAIVHIAIFDSINAVIGGYKGYTGHLTTPYGTSVDAAIAQAAHDTLVAVYPSQSATFDSLLADDLNQVTNADAKHKGIALGQKAAAAILALRANDGSQFAEPRIGSDFIPSNQPGKWRPDPISQVPLAVGALWSRVTPFVLTSASQFRIPPPPALTSAEYTAAFNKTKDLGGGVDTPTNRTADQTIAGIYWAYDGVPHLGAPPRLYNQVVKHIAKQVGTGSLIKAARLLALVNVAMADAGIAAWESKYYYQEWRPVGGVRESDPGTGPTGLGDGNAATIGNPNYTPLGGQADFLSGPNFTPPFPAYPSGHATFGGSVFQVLRKYYGTDAIPFTFVSDEYNGITQDNLGNVRPLIPRSFASFSQAEEENGQSRIYLGVHWEFDKVQGINLGHNVANYVFSHVFQHE